MAGYYSGRAFLAWILLPFVIFFALRHYGLLPAAPPLTGSEDYVTAVLTRTLSDPLCLSMALGFLGCLAYSLALLAVLNGLNRTELAASGGRGPWYAFLAGVPSRAANAQNQGVLVEWGIRYASAPIRDAAILFPAVGFLGTVIGVSIAIEGLENVLKSGNPSLMMAGLRTAFDTTFWGLVASLLLTLVIFAIDTVASQITARVDASTDLAAT